MWGDKKPDAPLGRRSRSKPSTTTNSECKRTIIFWGGKNYGTLDSTYPARQVGRHGTAGRSLHVKGEITGNEDLHIDGSVEGLVQLEDRKLTVGASAKVTADIIAREVVVYGNVKGNLRARDRIEIKKDGSVVGDLTTARIMIEDGAYFKGSIEIDKTGDASDDSDEKLLRHRASRSTAATSPTIRFSFESSTILPERALSGGPPLIAAGSAVEHAELRLVKLSCFVRAARFLR